MAKLLLTKKQYELMDYCFNAINGRVIYTDSFQKNAFKPLQEKGCVEIKRGGTVQITDLGKQAIEEYEIKKVRPTSDELSTVTEEEYEILYRMIETKKEFTFPDGTFQAGHFPRTALKIMDYKGYVTLNAPGAVNGYPYETVSLTNAGREAKVRFESLNNITPPTEEEKKLYALIRLAYASDGKIVLSDPETPQKQLDDLYQFAYGLDSEDMRQLSLVLPDELKVVGDILFVRQANEFLFKNISS